MAKSRKLKITQEEVTRAFSTGDWSVKYPPILTVVQAAELFDVPTSTIYQWNSEGKLTSCSQRIGKHLRLFRERFVTTLMNKGI